jgi:hypothetical protein
MLVILVLVFTACDGIEKTGKAGEQYVPVTCLINQIAVCALPSASASASPSASASASPSASASTTPTASATASPSASPSAPCKCDLSKFDELADLRDKDYVDEDWKKNTPPLIRFDLTYGIKEGGFTPHGYPFKISMKDVGECKWEGNVDLGSSWIGESNIKQDIKVQIYPKKDKDGKECCYMKVEESVLDQSVSSIIEAGYGAEKYVVHETYIDEGMPSGRYEIHDEDDNLNWMFLSIDPVYYDSVRITHYQSAVCPKPLPVCTKQADCIIKGEVDDECVKCFENTCTNVRYDKECKKEEHPGKCDKSGKCVLDKIDCLRDSDCESINKGKEGYNDRDYAHHHACSGCQLSTNTCISLLDNTDGSCKKISTIYTSDEFGFCSTDNNKFQCNKVDGMNCATNDDCEMTYVDNTDTDVFDTECSQCKLSSDPKIKKCAVDNTKVGSKCDHFYDIMGPEGFRLGSFPGKCDNRGVCIPNE